jgi:hypothetical protein
MHDVTTQSTNRRTQRIAVAASAFIIALATLLAIPTTANATTGTLPPSAPSSKVWGDVLPGIPGTLGVPTALGSRNGQAVDIPGASTVNGTRVQTFPYSAGDRAERWYFYNAGTQQVGVWGGVTAYQIVNYNANGTRMCLTGLPSNGWADSPVGVTTCDTTGTDQNQLWTVANSSGTFRAQWADFVIYNVATYNGVIPPTGSYLTADLPALKASVPILSAAGTLPGTYTALAMHPGNVYPANETNSAWVLPNLGAKPPTVTPAPNCVSVACLFNGEWPQN